MNRMEISNYFNVESEFIEMTDEKKCWQLKRQSFQLFIDKWVSDWNSPWPPCSSALIIRSIFVFLVHQLHDWYGCPTCFSIMIWSIFNQTHLKSNSSWKCQTFNNINNNITHDIRNTFTTNWLVELNWLLLHISNKPNDKWKKSYLSLSPFVWFSFKIYVYLNYFWSRDVIHIVYVCFSVEIDFFKLSIFRRESSKLLINFKSIHK